MEQALVWLIIAVFYAPLHFGGPVGVVILIERETRVRRRMIRKMLLDCSLSMFIAFALAIWLANDKLGIAMAIVFFSMLLPYLLLYVHHRQVKMANRTG